MTINPSTLYIIKDKEKNLNLFKTLNIDTILKNSGGTIKENDEISITINDEESKFLIIGIQINPIEKEKVYNGKTYVSETIVYVSEILEE